MLQTYPMMRSASPIHVPTFAALGVLAFIAACAGHELVGHGGACWASGDRVLLITSVYARCAPGSSWVDAAGPLANLTLALLAYAGLRSTTAGVGRQFLALIVAFSGFWAAGYFIYSPISLMGDWAFVFHGQPALRWVWRVAMSELGVGAYIVVLRVAASFLPSGRPLLIAYIAAVCVACGSTLLFHGPTLPALKEAVLESGVAALGLPYIAARRLRILPDASAVTLKPNRWIIFAAILIAAVFFATLGIGLGDPAAV